MTSSLPQDNNPSILTPDEEISRWNTLLSNILPYNAYLMAFTWVFTSRYLTMINLFISGWFYRLSTPAYKQFDALYQKYKKDINSANDAIKNFYPTWRKVGDMAPLGLNLPTAASSTTPRPNWCDLLDCYQPYLLLGCLRPIIIEKRKGEVIPFFNINVLYSYILYVFLLLLFWPWKWNTMMIFLL